MTKGYSLVFFAALSVVAACGAADNGENPRSIAGNPANTDFQGIRVSMHLD